MRQSLSDVPESMGDDFELAGEFVNFAGGRHHGFAGEDLGIAPVKRWAKAAILDGPSEVFSKIINCPAEHLDMGSEKLNRLGELFNAVRTFRHAPVKRNLFRLGVEDELPGF